VLAYADIINEIDLPFYDDLDISPSHFRVILRANSLFEGQLSTINEGSMQAARGGRF
jgi:hypothetical protein